MFYLVCSKFMLFSLNSSHFMSEYLLVAQSVFKFIKLSRNIYSFCCTRFFTINILYGIHFWLSSNKLANYFSFRLIFHFTNNFFITLIKKFWILWIVTKVEEIFVLKKFFINVMWFYFISKTVCVSKRQFSINFS